MSKDAIIPNSIGYFFDNSKYQNEYVAILNASQKYLTPLYVGAAGSNKIINIIQKDFDRWNSQ